MTISFCLLRSAVEIKYFDKVYRNRSLAWYKNQFPVAQPDQLLFEKTPAYFPTPNVAERMHDVMPNTKLILLVKDPVKRFV